MSEAAQDKIVQVTQLLTATKRVCRMTGAGVSAESVLPTFRNRVDQGGHVVVAYLGSANLTSFAGPSEPAPTPAQL